MKKETIALALGIALLPPLWAVVSGQLGVTVGAVALICAGLYVTNGNKASDGVRISLGFLLGDLLAVIAVWMMGVLPMPADLATFVTLFVIGGAVVLLVSRVERWVFLPATLCGWAIGLLIMGPMGFSSLGTMPLQIAASMLAGVWYVGWGVDAFCRLLCAQRKG